MCLAVFFPLIEQSILCCVWSYVCFPFGIVATYPPPEQRIDGHTLLFDSNAALVSALLCVFLLNIFFLSIKGR